MKTISEHKSFGGVQGYYSHASKEIGLEMKFSVFQPPQAKSGKVPVLYYLAGLTCNEETLAIKAGARRIAAELGLLLVAPDTSPRGANIPGESAAPIAAPMRCPWGNKAFRGYLGDDHAAWREYDASELVKRARFAGPILVDQGLADKFLSDQLYPEVFEAACRDAGQPLTLRRRKATITAIFSFRRSWKTTCAIMLRTSPRERVGCGRRSPGRATVSRRRLNFPCLILF